MHNRLSHQILLSALIATFLCASTALAQLQTRFVLAFTDPLEVSQAASYLTTFSITRPNGPPTTYPLSQIVPERLQIVATWPYLPPRDYLRIDISPNEPYSPFRYSLAGEAFIDGDALVFPFSAHHVTTISFKPEPLAEVDNVVYEYTVCVSTQTFPPLKQGQRPHFTPPYKSPPLNLHSDVTITFDVRLLPKRQSFELHIAPSDLLPSAQLPFGDTYNADRLANFLVFRDYQVRESDSYTSYRDAMREAIRGKLRDKSISAKVTLVPLP